MTAHARWEALLQVPEITPAMRAAVEALIATSRVAGEAGGFPTYQTYDPRSGRVVTWAVTGLRPNGITGWFQTAAPDDPVGARPGSWRIGFDGRMHRGLPWMRALTVQALSKPPPSALSIAAGLIEAIEASSDAPPALRLAASRARLALGGQSADVVISS